MSYVKKTWVNGDVIQADNLNNIENKVEELDNIDIQSGTGLNSLKQTNATALGANSIAYGTSIAGSKAYIVSEVDEQLKTFTFASVEGLEVGMEGNIYIYDGETDTNYMRFGLIESINGNEVTFDKAIAWEGGTSLQDSYIWFTHHPELGDVVVGSGAVAEGFETNASQVGSHSEGIQTVALGKYSHAEGRDSLAGGYCSHAEGRQTYTEGLYSHAEGRETIAKGNCSNASGYKSEANGNYSSARGRENIANGDHADVSGQGNLASGYASSACGTGNKATGSRAIATGYNCEANGATSIAGGATSKANHDSAFAFGTRVQTSRANQVVFGRDNADDPNALVIIGNGANQNSKRNTFVVYDKAIKVGDTIITEAQLQALLALLSQ